ncbi:GNAT family N-acetyltransferase [Paraburkholderia silvatlantica]|uniref:GNAT superfamily N-acetyltransferase n=1 Tax=Paraburkholderia silvatlantica TaxID=321895 RepID=A0ABR6FNM3_9BURK|nr:GNAT family N-acetyltransferase [Paraburkholderia silvatlantica]MBB2928395.1 GNAT superfamily N-acetyltransferase [Paraburkholderia silvatlantica]PVY34560.1 acetyltransferase (GNAT) family protein [Paraburkholderia silvatlantica]PXW38775.1 acetyltransferase (GNAT) family protein [Paraburkholderia silvatlantica]
MITFAIESFEERLPELRTLLPMHYEELALDQEHVPLSPQFDIYVKRERLGEVMFVTVRERGELIGYFIGFVAPGLHYSTCLTCIMDIFYVRKDRRTGSTGVRLFRFVERELRRRGVKRWFMGSKVHADASALFERIGARRVEVYYSKWLGDGDAD